MGTNNQPSVIAVPILSDHLNADTVISECLSDLGKYSGSVLYVEIDVIPGLCVTDPQNRKFGISALPRSTTTQDSISGRHHDIA